MAIKHTEDFKSTARQLRATQSLSGYDFIPRLVRRL